MSKRREFPKQVKRDAFVRANGQCEGCGAHLAVGRFHYDHDIPNALGGEPTLDNCRVLCLVCHGEKTAKQDVPRIAKAVRIADREMGIRPARKRLRGPGFRKAPPQRNASRPIVRRHEP